ncbi:hypothetical protein EGW08_006547 [Elysia chlorotica]|uniref:Uncharacterized protein n=1 Tax=Elysia chlorotica TaxID=188477 RepID=A0A433TVR5_ELYCH|nr:hypothetical protein EGW08_006547 [Elysia chlorotica]
MGGLETDNFQGIAWNILVAVKKTNGFVQYETNPAVQLYKSAVQWSVVHQVQWSVVHQVQLSVVHQVQWSVVHQVQWSVVHQVQWSVVHQVQWSVVHQVQWSVVHQVQWSVVHQVQVVLTQWSVVHQVQWSVVHQVQVVLTPAAVCVELRHVLQREARLAPALVRGDNVLGEAQWVFVVDQQGRKDNSCRLKHGTVRVAAAQVIKITTTRGIHFYLR